MGNSVLWIRNDFRFHDNTALINAINDIKDNENLIFIYHLDPEIIKIETTSYAYFFSSFNSYYERKKIKGLDIYFLYGEEKSADYWWWSFWFFLCSKFGPK